MTPLLPLHRPQTRSADSLRSWHLAGDARVRPAADGTCTVIRGAMGVELDAESAVVARWLATPRTLAELLQQAAIHQPPLPPLAVVRALVRLEDGHVLQDSRTAWGLALPGTAFIGRILRHVPTGVWLRGAQAFSACALVWLLLWLAIPRLLPPPFGLNGSDVAVLTAGLLVTLLLLRTLARGLAAQAVGLPGAAQSLRLRWQAGAEVTSAAMTAMERRRALVIAWSGLSVLALALLVSVTGVWLSPQPLWRVAVWMCSLALLVNTSPELPTDARTLLSLATATPALGSRARAWLVRRAVKNLWQRKPMSDIEARYVLAASLSALHVLVTWLLTARRLLPWTLELVNGGIRHGNALWAALPLGLTVLWLVVLLVGLAAVLTDLARQLWPKRTHADVAISTADYGELFLQAARQVPFLEQLGDAVLGGLPVQMMREAWRSGDTILRQGDPGDRLCCLVEGHAVVEWEDLAGVRHQLARLGPGDFFGESAVFEETPRTAHVIADGPVQLYTLSRDACQLLVQNSVTSAAEIRRQLRHTAALREHALFAGLNPHDLAAIVAQTQPETHAAGEVILQAGEPGQDVFVILGGTCSVWQQDVQTGTLGPRDWFGELALLTGAPRNATVRTTTAVELLRVPAAATQQALARDPAAAMRLWEVAAERLQAMRGEP